MLRYAVDMKKRNIPWPLVEALLSERGRDRPWLEAQLDVKKNQITNWKTRGVPRAHADSLAILLKTSTDYLLGVPGSQKANNSQTTEANVEPGPEMRERVPLISFVQAGAWCEAADPYNVGDAEDWLACPVAHGPRTYALRVRGQSMFNPGGDKSFAEGDIIFVDPDRDAIHKSLIVMRLVDSNEATFKRLLIDGEKRFLEALNPSWPNRIFEINGDTRPCGVVIAKLESFV